MDINIAKVIYLFLRLSPFMLVSYFTMMSIFNQDIRGLIYLSGLLFTCICALSIGKMFQMTPDGNYRPECAVNSIGSDSAPFSIIPLGILTISYTFWYIFSIIADNNLWANNIAALIIIPLMFGFESYFQMTNNCSKFDKIFISAIIGLLGGVIWWAIISGTGYIDLQLFVGVSSKEICDRPIRSKYRCRMVNN